ncbi:MAG: F0F1 ATP synthase subunit A [Endomicrobiaceae bacterium]|nr:F0F1 ATP synthase subunit A [Endomicrobiaceae bacterium]
MTIAPNVLSTIFGVPITNTVLMTIITDVVIIAVIFAFRFSVALYPRKFQNMCEMVIEYFYNATKDIAGERARYIYPWVTTFFIMIVISNFIGLLPGVESIRFHPIGSTELEGVPLLRTATSDLNLTLALAVISLVVTHILSIKYTGIKSYIGRFISFKMLPIFLFVGLLEFIGEFTKILSFSFRLFGNIWAGEIVLGTVTSIIGAIPLPSFLIVTGQVLAKVPFMMLETIVALIQAIVFAMLTMVFMSIMTDKNH